MSDINFDCSTYSDNSVGPTQKDMTYLDNTALCQNSQTS